MSNIVYIKNKLNIQEAICVSIAYAIALILFIFFDTSHASWIPMTVGLMFAIPIQGAIVQKSFDRAFGTFIGLLLAFFYVQTFMYADYRWGYLIPFIFLMMFYIINVTQNYGLGSIAISIFIPLVGILFTQHTSYSLGANLIKRLFFTLIGICISLLCEFAIYKFAAHSEKKLKNNTRMYFIKIGEILSISNKFFVEHKKIDDDLHTKINTMIGHIMSIEDFYILSKYEYAYDDNKKQLLTFVSKKIHEIVKSLQQILCILNQNRLADEIISVEDFKIISKSLTYKYKNYIKLLYSDLGINKRIEIVEKIKEKDIFTPTGLYLTQLSKLDYLLYSTINGIRNKEY
jgi:hypothetical protein